MSESQQNLPLRTQLKNLQRKHDALERRVAQLAQRPPAMATPRHVRLVKTASDSTYPLASNIGNTFGTICNEQSFTNTEGSQTATNKARSASVQQVGQGLTDQSPYLPYIKEGEFCLQLEQPNNDPVLIPIRRRAFLAIAAEDIAARSEDGTPGGVLTLGTCLLYEIEDVASSMTLRPWAFGSFTLQAYNATGLPIITGQFVRIELEEVSGELHITELVSANANYRVGCAMSAANTGNGAGTVNLTLDLPSAGWMANSNMPIYADGTGLVFNGSHVNIMAGVYVEFGIHFELNTADPHASLWTYEQIQVTCSNVSGNYAAGGSTELLYPAVTFTDSNGDTYSPAYQGGPAGPISLLGQGFVIVSGSPQNLRLAVTIATLQATTYDITKAFLTAEPFGCGDGVSHA